MLNIYLFILHITHGYDTNINANTVDKITPYKPIYGNKIIFKDKLKLHELFKKNYKLIPFN